MMSGNIRQKSEFWPLKYVLTVYIEIKVSKLKTIIKKAKKSEK
jgi:hypothetical protein